MDVVKSFYELLETYAASSVVKVVVTIYTPLYTNPVMRLCWPCCRSLCVNYCDFQVTDYIFPDDRTTCYRQPMYNFSSLSKHPEKQSPMHQERGFLRIKPGTNDLAFIVSHNFGLTSLEEGTCDPEKKEIVLETVAVQRMSFSKPPVVKKFKRIIKLVLPDTLEVTLFMETDSTPLTEHLRAVYKKVEV